MLKSAMATCAALHTKVICNRLLLFAGGVVAIHAIATSAAPATTQGPPRTPPDLSVWAGILHLLSDPHVASFFFLTALCGVGYGAVGYVALFLRQQGGQGRWRWALCGKIQFLFLTLANAFTFHAAFACLLHPQHKLSCAWQRPSSTARSFMAQARPPYACHQLNEGSTVARA